MALDVLASIEIARRPDEVAAYEFDPVNDPTWIGGVTTAERLTEGPMAAGSRVRRQGSFIGRPIEWVMDVVEHVPGRRLAMHAIRSPFPMDVTYELAPSPLGTRATIRIRGEAAGLYGLLGPLTPLMVRRSVQTDLARLKRALERGPG
ncbi:MAG TPA: SRPBCC family protein [Candidatus Limnocylindrales bacterium]|nr:SRPBCC family protein [Candidatus Limnocylindrales bacterium]